MVDSQGGTAWDLAALFVAGWVFVTIAARAKVVHAGPRRRHLQTSSAFRFLAVTFAFTFGALTAEPRLKSR